MNIYRLCILIASYAILGASSLTAQAPTTLFLDAPSLVSGSSLQIGSVYRFSNVTTGTDALLSILNLRNGASIGVLDDFGSGGSQASFQPTIIGTPSLNPTVDFNISFVASGTSAPVVLNNVNWSFIDIDGEPTLSEFNQAGSFQSYTLENPTNIGVTDLGGGTYKFSDTSGTSLGGIGTGGAYAVTVQYSTLQSFDLTMGMQGSYSSGITRLFSSGTTEPAFVSPSTFVPEPGGATLIAATGLLILLRRRVWTGQRVTN